MMKLSKLKCVIPALSLRLSLAIYGCAMAMAPIAIYVFMQYKFPEFDEVIFLLSAIFGTFFMGAISCSLIFVPIHKMFLSSCTTLKLKQRNIYNFSIRSLRSNFDMISRMAILGHESIKGFRALPTPAVLFDRNGIIISQSAGLSNLLHNEFDKVKAGNGSLFFVGEHISSIVGNEKAQYLQKYQDTPLTLKHTQDVKIIATLSRINDGGLRKEAGLILFGVEYKHENSKAVQLPTESFAPEEAALLIQELKSTCITITNSFTAISQFMHNMAEGKFEHNLSLESKGEIGKLMNVANKFAHNLQEFRVMFTPRLQVMHNQVTHIHTETDEILASSALAQKSFAQTFRHFTASTISDTHLNEIFSNLNSVMNLVGQETVSAHNSIILSVNQVSQLSNNMQNIEHFVTFIEDLGFHLKLLGLTAAVEAAKHDHSESLNELCKDIRGLGEKFRSTGSQFRTIVEPLNNLAQNASHSLAIGQNALVQLGPLIQKASVQLQQQEKIVGSALKPRIEALQTIEQALNHSKAVHETLLNASLHIQNLTVNVKDIFELASIVLPNEQTSKESVITTPRNELNDTQISLEWFKRDVLLRELSGEIELDTPNHAANMPVQTLSKQA